MKSPRFTPLLAGTFAIGVLTSSFGWAQLSVEKVTSINKTLQTVKTTYSKLNSHQQKALDGNANIVHLADAWEKYGMRLTDPTFFAGAKSAAHASNFAPAISSVVRVSDPSTDVAYSSFGGFTQSETSTARCGNNVVVGFNDSGSIFETPFYFSGAGGQSVSGFAYSSNGGVSFTDGGPVNPGPGNGNLVFGDPVVNCSDQNTFFYSQIFDFSDSTGNPFAAIAVSKSSDAGRSWNDPVAAIAKSGFTHLLDKPWSTIDPSNPKRIFVSYTDFDNSGDVCGFVTIGGFKSPIPRSAIEFVESTNGGTTWSAPHVAIQFCADPSTGVLTQVQGSQLAVSSNGTLHISWVNLGANFPSGIRTIQASSFTGSAISAPVNVTAVQPGGDSYYLQGEFRDFLDMAMAIDHSGLKGSDGDLYITWADGRDKIVPDPLGTDGAYAFDDILLVASFDGGNTWFGPVRVNSDFQSRLGDGHDHYQVGIAVDKRGVVGACWYDRRADSENFAIRRHCGESTDNGFTFSDADIGMPGFAPTHGIDLFLNPIYMGDYDQMTSDFLNQNSGFIGAFQNQTNRGNPDVDAHSMN